MAVNTKKKTAAKADIIETDMFQTEYDEIISEMRELSIKKGHDYADKEDRLSNFKLSELAGVPSWVGILIRCGDKYSRLMEYAKKGEFMVKDESVEDDFRDLANYAILGLIAYRSSKL